jgi:hypothetical protein
MFVQYRVQFWTHGKVTLFSVMLACDVYAVEGFKKNTALEKHCQPVSLLVLNLQVSLN